MRLSAAFALTLIAAPAGAEGMFKQSINGWTIEQIFETCAAYNRPNVELNTDMIHALGLSRTATGETGLVAAFWPGALEDGDSLLEVTLGAVDVEVAAKRLEEGPALQADLLPQSLVDALAVGTDDDGLVTITAEPSLAQVNFDASDLPAVMAALDACQLTLE